MPGAFIRHHRGNGPVAFEFGFAAFDEIGRAENVDVRGVDLLVCEGEPSRERIT